jgi:hypothetical protein
MWTLFKTHERNESPCVVECKNGVEQPESLGPFTHDDKCPLGVSWDHPFWHESESICLPLFAGVEEQNEIIWAVVLDSRWHGTYSCGRQKNLIHQECIGFPRHHECALQRSLQFSSQSPILIKYELVSPHPSWDSVRRPSSTQETYR